jgi:RimJ/RimL family protein N-acetyltransferase
MGPDAGFRCLAGERVVLRRHAPTTGAFQRWYSDPEVVRLTRYQDGPMRRDEIERFFAARALGPDSLSMAIHVRADDRLIGTCALSQLDSDNGSALFHITIGEKDAWGRGYGTDATRLMVDHAFTGLGLHRIALTVFGSTTGRSAPPVGVGRRGPRPGGDPGGRWWTRSR